MNSNFITIYNFFLFCLKHSLSLRCSVLIDRFLAPNFSKFLYFRLSSLVHHSFPILSDYPASSYVVYLSASIPTIYPQRNLVSILRLSIYVLSNFSVDVGLLLLKLFCPVFALVQLHWTYAQCS